MTPQLPAGYTARPAVREDAEAVVSLLHAYSLAVSGEIENSLKGLLGEWNVPDLDLARDSLVVFAPDGRLIAYSVVWNKSHPVLPFVNVFLHASEWDRDTTTCSFLLAWGEARTLENLPQIAPEQRVALRGFCDPRDGQFLAALTAAGFQPIRQSFEMAIDFDEPPKSSAWPEGFTLRIAEPDDDPLPVLDAFRDAWRDHFGYIERPYEESLESWRYHWAHAFQPGLWLLGMAGDTVAGLSLCLPEIGGKVERGYVQTLAVRRAYRRHGLAEALLRESFVRMAQMGKTGSRLSVDGASLTGATRLYERVGMHVHNRYTLFEKELRPGIDPSTTEVGAAVTVSEAP